MKLYLFALLFLVSNSIHSKVTGIDSLKLPFEYYTLDNGLEIVLQPDLKAKGVAIEFWIKAGAAIEADDQQGLAHFFEHVTPYGLRGQKENIALFKQYATNTNAQTKKDFTRYYTEFHPEGLDIGLKYNAERLKSAKEDISLKKVEHERKRVFKEIERQSSYPFWSSSGAAAMESATFGKNHPYGHGAYGTLENNEKFTLADVQSWHSKYVAPNNTILFVIGNFDVTECKQLIDKYFKDIPKKKIDLVTNFSPDIDPIQPKTITAFTNAPEHYLSYVWKTKEWGSKENSCYFLLGNILNQRLVELAKNNAIIIDSGTDYLNNVYKYSGQFGMYASFKKLEDKNKVRRFLRKELRKIIKQGVSENEVEKAKQRELDIMHEKQARLGFEYSRAELLGESLLFKNDPNYYFVSLENLQNITALELDVFIRQNLSKKYNTVLLKSRPGNDLGIRKQ